jgi:cytosine deaminase
MDPWYSLGNADMLEVASMAVHVGQMTARTAIRACYESVTEVPARLMGLEGYGIAPGRFADLVWLQAKDPIEAIRLRPARLAVIRRGRVIARTARQVTSLDLPDRPAHLDGADYRPGGGP